MSAQFPYASETLGVQQIVSAFNPVFPNLRILTNLIIPLPSGSPIATAEIDAMVICEAGMYIFEIKGWRNAYVYRAKSSDAPTRWFMRPDGSDRSTEVMDPASQGGRKMTLLRSLLPERMRVHYYVLLPCDGIELDPLMPAGILTKSDLPYVARAVRSSSRSSKSHVQLDPESIDIVVQMMFSLQGDLTLKEHIRNCHSRRDHVADAAAAAAPVVAVYEALDTVPAGGATAPTLLLQT